MRVYQQQNNFYFRKILAHVKFNFARNIVVYTKHLLKHALKFENKPLIINLFFERGMEWENFHSYRYNK